MQGLLRLNLGMGCDHTCHVLLVYRSQKADTKNGVIDFISGCMELNQAMAIVAFHHGGLLSSYLQNLALYLHSSAIRVRRDGQVRDEPIIAKQRTKQSRT